MFGKIYFHYGTMNSGKSTSLLQLDYNFRQNGFSTIIYKPIFDKRDGKFIRSRLGLKKEAQLLPESLNFTSKKEKIVLIDECQFLKKSQFDVILKFADDLDCQVHCFGLRTNSHGKLFEGSKFLFEVADELIEVFQFDIDQKEKKKVFHLDISGKQSESGLREGDVGNNDYLIVSRKEFFDKYKKEGVQNAINASSDLT